MKTLKISLITLAVIAICIFYGFALLPAATTTSYGDAETIGNDEDANARAQYEWMQLHDPATGKIPAHIRQREIAFAATLPFDAGNSFANGRTTSTLSWLSRGPWNVGGRTRAFGIDIADANTLIAGSCSGGMWRSTDGGTTWNNTNPNNTCQSVTCLAQDTRTGHTNVWYYGSGEAYGASAGTTGGYYYGDGIYKSTDNGLNWTVLPATSGTSLVNFDNWGDMVWNIVTDPSSTTSDIVYAAAIGGIYRSADGGTSWTRVLGSGNAYFTDVAISRTGVVFATLSNDDAQKGLYRSTDGTTFVNITPDSFPTSYNRIKIGISPSFENQVYFLGNTPGFGQPDTNYVGTIEWNSLWRYTYLSGDGSGTGGAWQDRSINLPTTGGPFDKFQCQGSYDLVVKVKPDDTNTVFIGGTNLYRSTSAFSDDIHTTYIGGYQQGAVLPIILSYSNHHPDQHEVFFYPGDPNKMISTNDGGIFKTIDNMASTISWTPLNNGYLTSMFYTCAIDHATTSDIIIGGAQDNGSWYTNSASATTPWVSPRGGDGSYCAIADNSSAYYFSIQQGKIMRAKLNASGGVDSFARIDPIGGRRYQFINPFIIDPNDNNIMYMAGGSVMWRNSNLSGIPYAGNWDSIRTNWAPFPDSLPSSLSITALAVSKSPGNRLYFGTNSKRVYRVDNANTGTPAKRDITSYGTTVPFPIGNVSCIAVDPTNADHVMVVFSNYNAYSLYFSTDGGSTWQKVAGNLEQNALGGGNGPSCRWASILPVTGGTVYLVGTSVGLFATTELKDTSTVWVKQGVNTIGNAVVDMIDYRSTDGLVVVATHSQGIFSSHITHVADVNRVNDHNRVYGNMELTISPNPCAGEALISFHLTENDYVSCIVTDATGKIVSIVANDEYNAGAQSLHFDSKALPHGVYYCAISTKKGRKAATRLVVL